MREPGADAGLAAQPPHGVLAAALEVEALDGDLAAQALVVGEVDPPHPSYPKPADDAVAAREQGIFTGHRRAQEKGLAVMT